MRILRDGKGREGKGAGGEVRNDEWAMRGSEAGDKEEGEKPSESGG